MNETSAIHQPSATFNYYRGNIYWNNFEEILHHINIQISGDSDVSWQQYLKSCYGNLGTAFIPSCGNGWVERELYELGIINHATGFDIGSGMIDEARRDAERVGMSSKYTVGDINSFAPSESTFDLIVNHAAMHHVAYINRVTYQIARMINEGGIYVSFDYVGPHRNQYPWEVWSSMIEFNATLPKRFQAKLTYPHMKTMLNTDPTEAIHSELQVDVMNRYFDLIQYNALGGPIAYQILYQNAALFDEQHTLEGRATLERIIAADIDMLKAMPESNLFSFWIAKPKKSDFPSQHQIESWEVEENDREEDAKLAYGRYYPIVALELINNEIADLSYQLSIRSGS